MSLFQLAISSTYFSYFSNRETRCSPWWRNKSGFNDLMQRNLLVVTELVVSGIQCNLLFEGLKPLLCMDASFQADTGHVFIGVKDSLFTPGVIVSVMFFHLCRTCSAVSLILLYINHNNSGISFLRPFTTVKPQFLGQSQLSYQLPKV